MDLENFLEKVQQNGPAGRKEDRKTTRTRQRNKTGDSKVESNDSPEIPDRGKTSDIPSLPSGVTWRKRPMLTWRGVTNKLRRRRQDASQKLKLQQPSNRPRGTRL